MSEHQLWERLEALEMRQRYAEQRGAAVMRKALTEAENAEGRTDYALLDRTLEKLETVRDTLLKLDGERQALKQIVPSSGGR